MRKKRPSSSPSLTTTSPAWKVRSRMEARVVSSCRRCTPWNRLTLDSPARSGYVFAIIPPGRTLVRRNPFPVSARTLRSPVAHVRWRPDYPTMGALRAPFSQRSSGGYQDFILKVPAVLPHEGQRCQSVGFGKGAQDDGEGARDLPEQRGDQ